MPEKNEMVELRIDSVAGDGSGVGRVENIPVFVPFTAPGDRLRAKIVKSRPGLCFGIAAELLEPSPARVEAGCPVFGRCGGCSLRHIDYAQELLIKNEWVRENMRRIGKLSVDLPDALSSPQVDCYRNKAIYQIRMDAGKPVLGFFSKRSHRVVPAGHCPLHPRFFGDIAEAFGRFLVENAVSVYDEETHTGVARALFVRWAEATGEVMVCVVANADSLPGQDALVNALRTVCPQLRSVFLSVNRERTNVLLGRSFRRLWGADAISDRLCGLKILLSPQSFYQVNRAGAERLYAVAADFAGLTGSETLLDLYCGAGTIGLSMAGRAGRVIGVETVPAAVRDAAANAAENGIANARFLCADAGEAARQLSREGIRPDVVVLDPPRKGCSPDVIDAVAQMAPSRVVMISCDSATAARDAAAFAAAGYCLRRIQAVDMFPRTAHVETVILMSKT